MLYKWKQTVGTLYFVWLFLLVLVSGNLSCCCISLFYYWVVFCWYRFTTIGIAIHLFMDIWVVSSFQFLVHIDKIVMNNCTQVSYRHMLSFLLGQSLGMECLDCMVSICLTLKETARLLQCGGTILHSHQQHVRAPHLANTWYGQSL